MKKVKPSARKAPTRKKPYHVGSGSTLSRKKPGASAAVAPVAQGAAK